VQAIRQFDQYHPHITGHRQQHLAEIFGLGFLKRLIFNPVNLRHTIDEFRGNLAKILGDLLFRNGSVFHDVME
jgi:hypothetical protein